MLSTAIQGIQTVQALAYKSGTTYKAVQLFIGTFPFTIVLYWLAYLNTNWIATSDDGGYDLFMRSFIVPDVAVGFLFGATSLALARGRQWFLYTGLCASSSIFFLGLADLVHDIQVDKFSRILELTYQEVFETVVVVTVLVMGSFVAGFLWKTWRTQQPSLSNSPELDLSKSIVAYLLLLPAMMIVYWVSYFASAESESASYYVMIRLILPEFVASAFLVLAAIGLIKRRLWALFFGLCGAGGLIFHCSIRVSKFVTEEYVIDPTVGASIGGLDILFVVANFLFALLFINYLKTIQNRLS